MVGAAAGTAVQGKAQGDAAGEGFVRYKAQVAEIVIPVRIIAVSERGIAEIGAGERRFVPFAVAGINRTVCIVAGAGAVKDQIFEDAGAAALVIELLKIILVKGNLFSGFDGVGNVSLGGGGAGFADGDLQGAVNRLGAAAVGGKGQGDAAGIPILCHETQIVQIIVAVAVTAIVELVIIQLGPGERFLAAAVVVGVDCACVGIIGRRTVKDHIAQVCAVIFAEELVEVICVKGHFLAGFYGIADGAALEGAGIANIDAESAFYLALFIAVQGKGQFCGFTVSVFTGGIVHSLDAVLAGVRSIAFGSIEPGVIQVVLVYAYLVSLRIHGVHFSVGVYVGQVGELHAVEAVAFMLVIIILEVAELQSDVVSCVYFILNIRRRFCGCHGDQRREHDQSHQKRRDALFQKSTHEYPPIKSELCYLHA